ncbi:MAG TPA: YceI family protein [Bacteroidia bacterium]|nr:YceI family protein [Bacteroidia bacterium]
MKRSVFLFTLISILCIRLDAQIYMAKEGSTSISFFSSAPLEDIEALNKGAVIVYNATSGNIQIRVSIQNFKFKNALMEEHFNENYLESSKYPNAEFRGKINETPDLSKDGENNVTVSGTMDMHGVKKDVVLKGVLTKAGNLLKISSKFKIKIADYNIEVPSMYVKNIAEEVEVTINSTLEPYQKK